MKGIPSLQIQTTPGQMQLPKLKGELAIDQYPSRASYNIKTIPDTTRDDAQRGHQTALATIGRIAADAVNAEMARLARLNRGSFKDRD